MHKNEPKVNSSLINYVIMVYELRVGTIEIHRSIASLRIQFWSWFNIPLKRINYTPVSYVNNNETSLGAMTYDPLYVDSPWTGVCNLIR